MKTFLGKFIVFMAIFLLLGAAAYFFAFWQPNARRVEQLNHDIAAAHTELTAAALRDELYAGLVYRAAQLSDELSHVRNNEAHVNHEWHNEYQRFLPAVFDDNDINERIHRIVTPHSDFVDVNFQYSQPIGEMSYNENNPNGPPEGIWLTPVSVTFAAGYEGVVAVLSGFAHEGVDNRVITYSLNSHGEMWIVTLQLDFLTLTPPAGRYNGDYIVHEGGY